MSDKRGFPRSIVDLAIQVSIEGKWEKAKIEDLTVEGILMELDSALKKDATATIKILQNEKIKESEIQIKIIRCLPKEGEGLKHNIVAQFLDPNDEFLMDVLALVHDSGPKKDRRGTIYGGR